MLLELQGYRSVSVICRRFIALSRLFIITPWSTFPILGQCDNQQGRGVLSLQGGALPIYQLHRRLTIGWSEILAVGDQCWTMKHWLVSLHEAACLACASLPRWSDVAHSCAPPSSSFEAPESRCRWFRLCLHSFRPAAVSCRSWCPSPKSHPRMFAPTLPLLSLAAPTPLPP